MEDPLNLETHKYFFSHNSDTETENGYYTVELRAYGNDHIFYSYKFLKDNKNDTIMPKSFGFYYSKQEKLLD